MTTERNNSAAVDVDKYLSTLPRNAQIALEKLRKTIKTLVPDATEVISYKIPAFKYRGRMLVWYAGFQEHCSFFPTAAVIKAHESELKPYQLSKGTIRFPANKPLSATLVKKLVRARLKALRV